MYNLYLIKLAVANDAICVLACRWVICNGAIVFVATKPVVPESCAIGRPTIGGHKMHQVCGHCTQMTMPTRRRIGIPHQREQQSMPVSAGHQRAERAKRDHISHVCGPGTWRWLCRVRGMSGDRSYLAARAPWNVCGGLRLICDCLIAHIVCTTGETLLRFTWSAAAAAAALCVNTVINICARIWLLCRTRGVGIITYYYAQLVSHHASSAA